MKLDLDNKHSPCVECYINRGHLYSLDDAICQKCEYNIAVQLLKVVLHTNDQCALCKNRLNLGGGYFDCKLTGRDDCICGSIEKDFAIDWHKAFKEYDIHHCFDIQ